MRKITFLIAALVCSGTLNIFAEDARTVITECAFTGFDPSIIKVGQTVGDAKYQLSKKVQTQEGAVYYIPSTMWGIYKWIEATQSFSKLDENNYVITKGLYYCYFQVRIDNDSGDDYGFTHRFPMSGEGCITFTMDGESWGEDCTAAVYDNFSWSVATSPTFLVGYDDFKKDGCLSGKFSINADGDSIQFASGNLQYAPHSDFWQFAKNQYDIIGADNASIASDYNGWIDLFGWGTGNNPTLSRTDNADYAAFTDWGTNDIANAGESQWRTLTADEWHYLLKGRSNAENLRGFGQIETNEGTFLLPDDWQQPSSVTFSATEANTYTTLQWAEMEAAGAVFLPKAGFRNGQLVNYPNYIGIYWTSSSYSGGDDYAQSVYLLDNNVLDSETNNYNQRSYGLSVRLVQDVEKTTGIEQAQRDKVPCTKVLRDGVLYIIRDGKVYNALGTEVR